MALSKLLRGNLYRRVNRRELASPTATACSLLWLCETAGADFSNGLFLCQKNIQGLKKGLSEIYVTGAGI
jgi:hypothetical protein